MADKRNPAGQAGAQSGPTRASPSVPYGAGVIDLRASVDQLDAWEFAYQLAWLIQLPDAMHEMAAPRLAVVVIELTERAKDVLDGAAQT